MRGLLLLALGGGLAHSTVAPVLRIGDVAPDIPLILVVLLALRRGPEFGCLGGFAAGLFQDAAAGGLIGVQAMTKAVAGFAIGLVGVHLTVTQPLVQVPGLVLLSLLEGVVRFALLKIFHYPAGFAEVMTYAVLPQALYNGFVGAVFAFGLAWAEAHRREPV